MLPSELLKTVTRGDLISPRFIKPQGEYLDLARDIIAVFKDHTGKKLGELKDILEEMEDQGFDYRLVRGLVALLERRCDLIIESPVDPAEIRKAVFGSASKYYPVTSEEKRLLAIKEAARQLDIPEDTVEKSLYADLDRELLLSNFREIGAKDLIRLYNLSLAQTLLFKATELRFSAISNHKEALRAVKRLQLMYTATMNGRVNISIDGPASALKFTERYGTSLARLLPHITACPGWETEASIVRKDFSGNPRIYVFRMSESTHGDMFPEDFGGYEAEEFDSEPEEKFYESFGNSGSGWSIVREPEPLITGKYLYIPDFLLEKNGVKVYVEIAGFWTPEYLKRKTFKLNEIKGKNLLVLASSRHSCDAFKDVEGTVIFFDKKVPIKPVLDRLGEFDEEIELRGVSVIESAGMDLEGEIIKTGDLAAKYGVPEGSIKKYFEAHPAEGYVMIGDEIVHQLLVDRIKDVLPDTMRYQDAVETIRSNGIFSADRIIQVLGYSVKWNGLDPDNTVIYKK